MAYNFDDDDYSFNSDEINEDLQVTYLGSVRINALKAIIAKAEEICENIRLNENKNDALNSDLLLENFSLYSQLTQLMKSAADHSDEEIEQLVDEIVKRTTKISFQNMDKILPDEDDLGTSGNERSGATGDAFDW